MIESDFQRERIKLGPGVLGYAAYVVIFAVVALGALAFKGGPLAAWAFVGLMVIVAAYLVLAAWFGIKYPGPALLSGGDLIKWRSMDIAAMNTQPILDVTPIANPALDTPATEPPERESPKDDADA